MDESIFSLIHGCNNILFDHVMLRASDTWTWLVMGLMAFVMLFKDRQTKQSFAVFVGVLICILLADQISSSLIKPWVARPRPCGDPYLGFSFPSSHAANNFAVITYLCLQFRHRLTTILWIVWGILVCYSRVYLAMHWPSDVLCGALLGALIGCIVYKIEILIQKSFLPTNQKYYSNAYTITGYNINDMYLLDLSIALTFLYVLV